MATRWYLTNIAAPYTPATLRGAWDDTAVAVTKAMQLERTYGGVTTTLARAETDAAAGWDVLLYRAVGPPLDAQTISGTIDLCMAVLESSASSDLVYHIHLYVTQGNSDTPRGTLLSDYVETTGNEWPTTSGGKTIASAQTLSSLAISAGDRPVIEIGYRALNASATSYTGTIRFGTEESFGIPMTADLTNGGTPTTTLAPWIEFSATITEQATATSARLTQAGTLVASEGDPEQARASQVGMLAASRAIHPNARMTQAGVLALTGIQILARLTQAGVLLLMRGDEVTPEVATSFGPLLWVEFEAPDGTRPYAAVELPDPTWYYHGRKEARVLDLGVMERGLSDEHGDYAAQRFSVTLADTDRYFRDLISTHDEYLINRRVVVRMIDIESWRLRMTPRTVGIGLVRDYAVE